MNVADPHPFVDHPFFHEPDADRLYGGTLPPLPPVQCVSSYDPTHRTRPFVVLSPEAQEQAFLRYNYARLRAATATDEPQRCRWAARAAVCREYIARHNLGLVWLVIRQYRAGWTENFDRDELQTFGNAGLAQAIDGYDVAKGCRFGTYAYYAILREIQKECGREANRRRKLPTKSLTTPFRGRDENDDQFDRTAEVAGRRWQDALAQRQAKDDVEHALHHGRLTDRERAVVVRRFGLDGLSKRGETLDAVARDLGITRERVRQIERRALRKLRFALRVG